MKFIIIFFSLLTLLYSIPKGIQRLKVHWWKKNLDLYQHKDTFDKVYQAVDGYVLSKKARQHRDAIEYLYGEIDFFSFIALIDSTKPSKEMVFYDLGSGTGKAVLACAMVFDVKKCVGIELFEILHKAATAQQHKLSQHSRYQEKSQRIQFIHDSFLAPDLHDASLIFINATAIIGKTWSQLCHKIDSENPQATIITTTKPLKSQHYHVLNKTVAQMSWGVVDCFIHRPKEALKIILKKN